MKFSQVLFAVLLFSFSAFAEDGIFKPLRTDTPPVIDGMLDETVWSQASVVTNFKTWAPDFGKEPTGQTEAMMAYDKENLYFAFRCYDKELDKIKTSVADRDKIIPDDWVCLNLDTFNDQQALTAFYINPLGIQADSRFAANNEDFNIDYVWYSAGTMTTEGYNVEVQIPLKSLRYADDETVTMSIIFERYVSRESEHSTYPALDPQKGVAFLTEMMPIEYHNLEHYTLVELLPAVTYSNKSEHRAGSLENIEDKPDFSLTAKYGVTSQLILDGTINPDFSQIESDAGQVDVNLRTDLYFSEKRPFFLEGNENFRVAATGASELDPIVSVVHTRTIVNPLVGVKLSGKLNAQTTLASIYAMDELPDELNMGSYAHFPIVRLKRSLSDDSFIGGIFSGRQTDITSNSVFGVDEMMRLPDASVIESHALFSFNEPNNLPDDQKGHALGLSYWKNTRTLDYYVTAKDISENFITETGYITRTGISSYTGMFRAKQYPESDIIQRIIYDGFFSATKDKPSDLWETYNYVAFQPFMFGSLNFRLKYSYSTEIFLGERFKTGGFHASAGGQFLKELYASLLYRRTDWIYYSSSPFQGYRNVVSANIRFQPIEELNVEGSFTFSDFYRESDDVKIYKYPIWRGKATYQFNQYFFLRGIVEYNDYREELLTDFLASFTYIPGTVMHLGYGSFYRRIEWDDYNKEYIDSDKFLETNRGFFFKMSYLWRS